MKTDDPLRSRKRRRTYDRLLANAVASFRARGVRRTRLSDVARDSEVSVATLFNYFPTKADLAEAWVRGELVETLSAELDRAGDRDRSLRSAIRAGCRAIAARSAAEPEIRLEAWREAGRADVSSADRLQALTTRIRNEQKRERVRQDVEAQVLAEMLIDAIEGGVISALRAQSTAAAAVSESGLSAGIRARVDLVFDGARKRNERVRPPPPR